MGSKSTGLQALLPAMKFNLQRSLTLQRLTFQEIEYDSGLARKVVQLTIFCFGPCIF
jgi:hypothetical protein